jgi:hypothetical protein
LPLPGVRAAVARQASEPALCGDLDDCSTWSTELSTDEHDFFKDPVPPGRRMIAEITEPTRVKPKGNTIRAAAG